MQLFLGAHYKLRHHLRQIIRITRRQGGATARLEPAELLGGVDIWMFPKYPGKTAIVPEGPAVAPAIYTFVQLHHAALCAHDAWLGTWINPMSGYWHIDITTGCCELAEAEQQALANSLRDGRAIVALYNMRQRHTVYLSHASAMPNGVHDGAALSPLEESTILQPL